MLDKCRALIYAATHGRDSVTGILIDNGALVILVNQLFFHLMRNCFNTLLDAYHKLNTTLFARVSREPALLDSSQLGNLPVGLHLHQRASRHQSTYFQRSIPLWDDDEADNLFIVIEAWVRKATARVYKGHLLASCIQAEGWG